jgi:hypothetical protein
MLEVSEARSSAIWRVSMTWSSVHDMAAAGERLAPISADLAVIIVNWNVRDYLRRCLTSLV